MGKPKTEVTPTAVTTAFVRRHYSRGPTAYYDDGRPVKMPTAEDVAYCERQFDRWLAAHDEEVVKSRATASDGIQANLVVLSDWIDGSYPVEILGTELHVRRRVDKLTEEVGEVVRALGGVFGENPRKGVTHTVDDLLGELLDVAIAALGAHVSISGGGGSTSAALLAKLVRIVQERVEHGKAVHALLSKEAGR